MTLCAKAKDKTAESSKADKIRESNQAVQRALDGDGDLNKAKAILEVCNRTSSHFNLF